jgi:hypothetical protein
MRKGANDPRILSCRKYANTIDGPSQCESVVGQLASGDEVCVRVATDALRKLRFSANFSDHKRASGSRLRARSARAGLDSCAVARRATTFW